MKKFEAYFINKIHRKRKSGKENEEDKPLKMEDTQVA